LLAAAVVGLVALARQVAVGQAQVDLERVRVYLLLAALPTQ
jgi:hypothetical protein